MIEQIAGDDRTSLPDGTDTVIEGAAVADDADIVTAEDRGLGTKKDITTSGGTDRGLSERLRSGREQLATQAGERTRGLVTQGLERTSVALAGAAVVGFVMARLLKTGLARDDEDDDA